MRVLIFLLLFSAIALTGYAQHDHLTQAVPEEADNSTTAEARKAAFAQQVKGVVQFNKRNYAASEALLRNAFNRSPDEETARYLYYALQYQGHDLEAADFRLRNKQYSFALPPVKRGFENIYIEFGPRVAVPPDTAGNIYYGGYGGFFRVSDKVRIWHTVSYLQQADNLGSYKQGQYFSALYAYFSNGWMIKPSLHYIYMDFASRYNEHNNVSYTDTVGTHNPVVYRTSARQTIRYNNPGNSHFIHVGLPVSRHMGAFTLEALPSLHVIASRYKVSFNYQTTGFTDSIRNNVVQGTKEFSETGDGSSDTSERDIIGQVGVAAGWRLPVKGEPLTVRGAVFLLFDNSGNSNMAYHASVSYLLNAQCRLYANWLHKGTLPLALDVESMYFNHYNVIRNRAGLSIQLFPLRRFSPFITYQYEQQERNYDKLSLIYHSVYLTLKYTL